MTSKTETILNLKNEVDEAIILMQQAEQILESVNNKNFKTAARFIRQSCQSIKKHKTVKTQQLMMRCPVETTKRAVSL